MDADPKHFHEKDPKSFFLQFLKTIIGFRSQTFHNNYLCKLFEVAFMLCSRAEFFKNTGNQLKDLCRSESFLDFISIKQKFCKCGKWRSSHKTNVVVRRARVGEGG